MNRVKVMLSGALTVAMLAAGCGASSVSLAQARYETSGEPPSHEGQAVAASHDASIA